MNILIAGGCDVPPPYGGLAGRILNSAAIWERTNRVHILLGWAKVKPDLLDTKATRIHAVYPPLPKERRDKIRHLLRGRGLGALRTLVGQPTLAAEVLREARYLVMGRTGLHRLTAVLDALNYARVLDDLIQREEITVIQAHYGRHESLLCEVVAARHRIPVVVLSYAEAVCWPEESDLMGSQARREIRPELDTLLARTLRGADHVCSPSAHCALGPRRFVADEKVTVVYSCIDTAAFARLAEHRDAFAKELGLAGKKVILYVGQLAPRKGPQFLAQAAPRILAANPDTQIVFIGSDIGGYRKKLEALVEPVKDRVTITGGIPLATLHKYYAVADALAFPTYTDRECMGMSMKEAMAAGTPVVAFRAGGTPEAVEDGRTGYLVKVGDLDGLADRLRAVIQGELGPEARTLCQERARRLFDIEVGAELEYQILARAVAERKTGAAVLPAARPEPLA